GINYNGSAIQIGLPAGTYQGYIRDKQGCEYFVGEATIVQPDQILVDLGPDIFMDIGIDTQLQALVSNGIPPYQYAWTAQDSTFLSCLDCPDPVVSGLEFTRTFRVIVTDANGCTSEAVITIHIQKVRIVLVPTAFTPNGDGQNERMGVMGRPGTVIREFQIFDRWGEQVFYADDFLIEDGLLPAHSWDGTFRGDLMNSAVFVWTLKAEFPDGETGFYKGQTTLVR
ncbi:MAG: gliding motility-associated C-terminal domain-containing protein, partial [Saprospiraceae bacterium]|nr:gliding motility-associated C-terminal domain-containing protein [Saprospiraceae bacterium]